MTISPLESRGRYISSLVGHYISPLVDDISPLSLEDDINILVEYISPLEDDISFQVDNISFVEDDISPLVDDISPLEDDN